MNPLRKSLAFAPLALALAAGSLFAQGQVQRPMPHIGYVYPAGGQQGTTFTVSVGGQNLSGAIVATLSDAGAQAKVTGYDRPLTPKELTDLRDQMQKLQDKRVAARADPTKPAFTVDDEKLIVEIRQKIATRAGRQTNPGLAETVTLEVTLAPDVPPGPLELRLRTPTGLSNPFIFCVGDLPEFSEPVVTVTSNPVPRTTREIDPRSNRPKTEMEITLPATVNGQILPGEVDHFHFPARKGQRIVAAVSARALIPYLADAVPGWFQATLALQDAKGRELAYDDDYRFNPDPVLCYDIPEDGNYVIEMKDAIFRGREDFVYRISVGELPFVTSIFPLGGTAGVRTTFELAGWNLPADKLTLETKDRTAGTFLVAVPNNGHLSNSVHIALDTQPESFDTEPNDRPENAQPLTLPAIVNGRIDRPGDEDVFCFDGKKGDEIVAEVSARRLGSPLDSTLALTDVSGRRLAFNDDYDDKGAGLLTHQADSRLNAKLPADGTYFIRLADAQHQGGPEYGYRLHLGAPRPDFELRVVPSSINVRAGMSEPITVYALRHDGFNGEIKLGVKDAPWGFALSGARIPANQNKVQLTLTAPPAPRDEPYELVLAGLATIQGRPVAHQAKALKVDVAGRGAPFRVLTRMPMRIPAGGTMHLQVAAPAARNLANIQLELSDAPAGMKIQQSSMQGEAVDVILSCDATKVKPGLQGNLLFNASGERTNPNAQNAANRVQRVPLGAVPAISFEIVAPEPAAKPVEKISAVP
jgi:hypothetical protein